MSNLPNKGAAVTGGAAGIGDSGKLDHYLASSPINPEWKD